MVANDPFSKVRAQLESPEPEPFKFESIGDELMGIVIRLGQVTFKDKQLWQLVVDTDSGPYRLLLPKDLEDKLVRERDVRHGDAVGIRLVDVAVSSGFKRHKVAVDPDRPRTAPASATSDPWGYDDDGNAYPDVPQDDEPPF